MPERRLDLGKGLGKGIGLEIGVQLAGDLEHGGLASQSVAPGDQRDAVSAGSDLRRWPRNR